MCASSEVDGVCSFIQWIAVLQDYYKAVVAEMLDGAPVIPHPATRMPMQQYHPQHQPMMHQQMHHHQMQHQMPGPLMHHSEPRLPPGPGGLGFNEEGEATTVLRLRGLPFTMTKEDIIAWFEDVNIVPITPNKYATELSEMCICIFVCVCVHAYVYMHVHLCVCVCVHVLLLWMLSN
jgi:hypothetical protein